MSAVGVETGATVEGSGHVPQNTEKPENPRKIRIKFCVKLVYCTRKQKTLEEESRVKATMSNKRSSSGPYGIVIRMNPGMMNI
jgi:hypothetical protein